MQSTLKNTAILLCTSITTSTEFFSGPPGVLWPSINKRRNKNIIRVNWVSISTSFSVDKLKKQTFQQSEASKALLHGFFA